MIYRFQLIMVNEFIKTQLYCLIIKTTFQLWAPRTVGGGGTAIDLYYIHYKIRIIKYWITKLNERV